MQSLSHSSRVHESLLSLRRPLLIIPLGNKQPGQKPSFPFLIIILTISPSCRSMTESKRSALFKHIVAAAEQEGRHRIRSNPSFTTNIKIIMVTIVMAAILLHGRRASWGVGGGRVIRRQRRRRGGTGRARRRGGICSPGSGRVGLELRELLCQAERADARRLAVLRVLLATAVDGLGRWPVAVVFGMFSKNGCHFVGEKKEMLCGNCISVREFGCEEYKERERKRGRGSGSFRDGSSGASVGFLKKLKMVSFWRVIYYSVWNFVCGLILLFVEIEKGQNL